MPADFPEQAEFCITIDFQKQSESPARVFRAMTGLIEAFQEIDRELVRSVDLKIEPVLLLEDVETGSLKAWLRTQLVTQDDNDIKNLNWKPVVGRYLVKAKYLMVNFLSDKTEISDRAQLQGLQRDLLQAAEETNMKSIPAYAPLAMPKLVTGIEKISTALMPLGRQDSATYITQYNQTNFNLEFNIAPERIEQLLTKESIVNEAEMILKVKRPDYLGDAMWDFRFESRTIQAKVVDEEWLGRFQSREVDVRPGDALRARIQIEVEYGYDGEVVAVHHRILKVISVIALQEPGQQPLLPAR